MRFPIALILLAVCAWPACASREPEPLDDAAIVRAVAERDLTHEGDTRWNADVRRARAALDVAEARARSAGWPGPVGLGVVNRDGGDVREGSFGTASFELLGALGLGPAREELVAAVADVDRARAALVESERRAAFAIRAAAVRWGAASARVEALAGLLAAARAGVDRVAALHRVGRVGDGPAARVEANMARLAARIERSEAAARAARSDYARATGLAVANLPDRPAAAGEVARGVPERVGEERVLATHPRLATLRADYAVAEARLRQAVVATWPRLRVGPRLTLSPDRIIPGGVLNLELPIPGSLDGEIDAAVAARADVRGRLEDALVSLLADIEARQVEAQRQREVLFVAAPELERGSAAAWRAAGAFLSVREGLAPVETWLDALNLRTDGVVARIDAEERVRLADLALRDAGGEAPEEAGP